MNLSAFCWTSKASGKTVQAPPPPPQEGPHQLDAGEIQRIDRPHCCTLPPPCPRSTSQVFKLYFAGEEVTMREIYRSALLHGLLITATLCVRAVLEEDAGAGGEGGEGGLGKIAQSEERWDEGNNMVLGKDRRCSLRQGGCTIDAFVEVHPVELESTLLTIVFLEGRGNSDLPPGSPPSPCLAAALHRHDDDGQGPWNGDSVGVEDAAEPGCIVAYHVDGVEIHREVGIFEGTPIQVEHMFRFIPTAGSHMLSIEVMDGQGQPVGSDVVEFEWKAQWQDPNGGVGPGKNVKMVERVVSELADWYEADVEEKEEEAEFGGKPPSRVTRVKKLLWEGLKCSLPRREMRIYLLEKVQV